MGYLTISREEFEKRINRIKWQALCRIRNKDRALQTSRLLYLEQRLHW